MRLKYFIIALLFTMVVVWVNPSEASPGESAVEPDFMYTGKSLIVRKANVPSVNTSYLGLKIKRFEPTEVNSVINEDYTELVVINNKSSWFVPVGDSVGDEFKLDFDHLGTRKAIFSAFYDDWDGWGISNSLNYNNTRFKIIVEHVFRLPDGRDVVGCEQEIYIQLAPAILSIQAYTDADLTNEIEGSLKSDVNFENLYLKVNWSQEVYFSGEEDKLKLKLNTGENVYADYVSGNGSKVQVFHYGISPAHNTPSREQIAYMKDDQSRQWIQEQGLQIVQYVLGEGNTLRSEFDVDAVLYTQNYNNIKKPIVIDHNPPEDAYFAGMNGKRYGTSTFMFSGATFELRDESKPVQDLTNLHSNPQWVNIELRPALAIRDLQSGVSFVSWEYFNLIPKDDGDRDGERVFEYVGDELQKAAWIVMRLKGDKGGERIDTYQVLMPWDMSDAEVIAANMAATASEEDRVRMQLLYKQTEQSVKNAWFDLRQGTVTGAEVDGEPGLDGKYDLIVTSKDVFNQTTVTNLEESLWLDTEAPVEVSTGVYPYGNSLSHSMRVYDGGSGVQGIAWYYSTSETWNFNFSGTIRALSVDGNPSQVEDLGDGSYVFKFNQEVDSNRNLVVLVVDKIGNYRTFKSEIPVTYSMYVRETGTKVQKIIDRSGWNPTGEDISMTAGAKVRILPFDSDRVILEVELAPSFDLRESWSLINLTNFQSVQVQRAKEVQNVASPAPHIM